jgi:hypothetical protein
MDSNPTTTTTIIIIIIIIIIILMYGNEMLSEIVGPTEEESLRSTICGKHKIINWKSCGEEMIRKTSS